MEKFKNVKNDLEKKKSTCFPLASSAVLFIYFFFPGAFHREICTREREKHEGKFKQKSRSIAWVFCVRICVQPDASDCVQANNQRSGTRTISETLPRAVEKGSKRLESFFLPRNAHNFLSEGLKILRPMIYFVHFHRYVCYRVFYCNFLRKEISWKFVLIYESNVRVWNIDFEFRFDYWNRPRVKFTFLSYPWF